MFAKYLMTSSLVAAVALTPLASAPAQAQDARDVIGGLLIGGAIGAAIVGSQQPRTRVIVPQQPRPPAAQPRAPSVQPSRPSAPRVVRPSIPATEAGRQVQTALNYFGFDAGFVDGQVGPSTRAAVERYQAFQNYPVNGRSFPENQALHLINAYQWANAGGSAQTGLQRQALLAAYQQHLAGTLNQPTPQPSVAPAPSNTTVIVNPATTTVVPAPGTAAPVTTVAAPAAGGPVPNLFAGAAASPALSSRCDAVALQGQANGGMMTLGNLTNPSFALSEQFCTARASAVNQGHDLTQAIAGRSYADITATCEEFSTAVAAQTAQLGTLAPQQAMTSAQGFAYTTGLPQAEMAATARVCLGIGYGADNMDMAMGSALMLVASGEFAYGELIGHHLREGFGLAADDAKAEAWYTMSLTAVQAGAPAVFSPTDAGRMPLIRQAVAMTLGGQPVPVPASNVVTVPSLNIVPTQVPTSNRATSPEIVVAPQSVLPTFEVSQ